MTYNEKLAERIRSELKGISFVEKKMFGGVGFLIHGNMACGVHKEDMVVRVDPENHNKLLKKSYVKPFDISGRPMKATARIRASPIRSWKIGNIAWSVA